VTSRNAVLAGLLLATAARAAVEPVSASGPLRLELPLLDLGFNVSHGWQAPSMVQSLAVARDFSTSLAWAVDLGLGRAWGESDPRGRWALELPLLALAAAASMELPFFPGWAHEEAHRAVMSRRGIGSYDEIWDLKVFAELVSVSRVSDDDLVRLKRDHPAEMARLSAAGMEGDIELARAVAADGFFDRRDRLVHLPLLLLTRANVVFYMWECDSASGDALTDRMNAREADPRRRDFTGLDCVAWAYDVQRPDEPYDARGPHPSGVGLNRYRKTTDLTPAERRLLTRARWLSLLNLADLSLWPVDLPVPWGPQGARLTFGFAHQMTSFGEAVTLDLYLGLPGADLRGAGRLYLSQHLALPGLEVEWVRAPLVVGGARLQVTPGAMVWLQPSRGRWDDGAASPGAQLRLRVSWLVTPGVAAFAEVQAKTAGWVAGTVLLGAGMEGRLGFSAVL
jgi:hypothetical protein